jgi:hypothetical protein
MNSHETKEHKHANISFEDFKDTLNHLYQNKKEIAAIAKKSKLEPLLAEHVANNLDPQKYREQYPEFSARYDQELNKKINDANCAKRQDILCVAATMICFIPSQILTFCHCCYSCDTEVDGEIENECGSWFAPLQSCGIEKNVSYYCPKLNFFCQPLKNLRDNLEDWAAQDVIIAEINSRGPNPQRME